MITDREVAILFSGGTDSALTAALAAAQFRKIHLLTFDWAGLHSIGNTQLNFNKLRETFPDNEFKHVIIDINKLAKHVFYENYLKYLKRHGFFVLSICGLCKLSMHARAAVYCIDNNISYLCDGANKGMHLFPAQMLPVIEELKKMYDKLGIEYFNPVFDYDGPQNLEFTDRLNLDRLFDTQNTQNPDNNSSEIRTTGEKLYALGIIPQKNVKGTALDRKMQPRCFQFILYNIFIHWCYLPDHDYEEFVKETVAFNTAKIKSLTEMLTEYRETDGKSKLARYI